MEAILKISSTKKSSLKRCGLLFLLSLQVLFIEACQIPTAPPPEVHYSMDDAVRSTHASRLLEGDSQLTADFNGDLQFRQYIKSYIEAQNDTIDSEKLTNTLVSVSRKFNEDPVFLLAVIKTESRFNQYAIGSVGEVGLMQIRPETAQWICRKFNIVWRGAEALKDPSYNVLVGSFYFQYLKKTLHKSKPVRYITAYNTGLGTLKKMSAEKMEEREYFTRVVTNYIGIYASLKRIKTATGSNSEVAGLASSRSENLD